MRQTLALSLAAVVGLTAGRVHAFCVEQPADPAGGVLARAAWPTMPVTYRIHDSGSGSADKAAEQEAIRGAFAQWAAATCVSLSFAEGALIPASQAVNLHHGENAIHFYWAHDDATWGGGPGPAKAVYVADAAGRITSATVLLNAKDFVFWAAHHGTPAANAYDVQSVVATEVGRVIGLGYSRDPTAVMTPDFQLASMLKRKLQPDDRAAVQYVYPSSAAGCGAPAAPDPLCSSGTMLDGGTPPPQDGGGGEGGGGVSCTADEQCASGMCMDGACMEPDPAPPGPGGAGPMMRGWSCHAAGGASGVGGAASLVLGVGIGLRRRRRPSRLSLTVAA